MDLKRVVLIALLVTGPVVPAWSQSQAALEKVLARYTTEQVEEMRQRANYKYEGLLLFYESSFLVMEDGTYRTATEEEIAAVDLDQYNAARAQLEDVVVHDSSIDRDLLLRSHMHFEELVLGHLNASDRAAYEAYKSSANGVENKGQR